MDLVYSGSGLVGASASAATAHHDAGDALIPFPTPDAAVALPYRTNTLSRSLRRGRAAALPRGYHVGPGSRTVIGGCDAIMGGGR